MKNKKVNEDMVTITKKDYEYLVERRDLENHYINRGKAVAVFTHEFNTVRLGLMREIKGLFDYQTKEDHAFTKHRKSIFSMYNYLYQLLGDVFPQVTLSGHERETWISGALILEMTDKLFGNQLDKHNIKVIWTPETRQSNFMGHPYIIKPTIINLIDNAIYWTIRGEREKSITITVNSKGFTIEDSGVGIPDELSEKVFEYGYTTRAGGQGIGLYITKKNLESIGFKLTLDPYEPSRGARFRVEKIEKAEIQPE